MPKQKRALAALSFLTAGLAIFAIVSFRPDTILTVDSPDFQAGGQIPARYSCAGDGYSPRLNIGNIPNGAAALAIIIHDPDAAKPGGVVHWVAWNLPAGGNIPENCHDGVQGLNSDGKNGYKPICPPDGESHHYNIYVYALDSQLHIDANTDKDGLELVMKGHILAQGELTGIFAKGTQ